MPVHDPRLYFEGRSGSLIDDTRGPAIRPAARRSQASVVANRADPTTAYRSRNPHAPTRTARGVYGRAAVAELRRLNPRSQQPTVSAGSGQAILGLEDDLREPADDLVAIAIALQIAAQDRDHVGTLGTLDEGRERS